MRPVRSRGRRGSGAALGLALVASLVLQASPPASTAKAQEPGDPGAPTDEPLEWKPGWHRANWLDGAVIVGGFSLYFADQYLLPHRDSALWTGPVLFDDPVRDALRARFPGNRDTASTISDAMMLGSLVHNWLFDNVVVALALRQRPDVAWNMSVANAQAYAITFSITGLVKTGTGRQRPFQQECADDPEYSGSCDAGTAYRSFFSGHAATTATGAGLLCAHHTHMPLYDGKVLDYGVCGVGVALTILTGAMRIASDKHWASDVLMGHVVGFSSGYLVPTLLYYTDDEEPAAAGDVVLVPGLSPESIGLTLMGRL